MCRHDRKFLLRVISLLFVHYKTGACIYPQKRAHIYHLHKTLYHRKPTPCVDITAESNSSTTTTKNVQSTSVQNHHWSNTERILNNQTKKSQLDNKIHYVECLARFPLSNVFGLRDETSRLFRGNGVFLQWQLGDPPFVRSFIPAMRMRIHSCSLPMKQ